MPSLDENVINTARYYVAKARQFHGTTEYAAEGLESLYAPLRAYYQEAFRGRDVLELACGTGFWTEAVAATARSLLATDLNSEVVGSSSQRLKALSNVRWQVANAYSLEGIDGAFTGAFAQYWWSHVPRKRLKAFLDTLHSRLQPGALVLFMDSTPYPANRRIDEHGDVCEERFLPDGTRFETTKNFPSEWEVAGLLTGIAESVQFVEHKAEAAWTLQYILK
jgi:SAM-dependent methyltransferase